MSRIRRFRMATVEVLMGELLHCDTSVLFFSGKKANARISLLQLLLSVIEIEAQLIPL